MAIVYLMRSTKGRYKIGYTSNSAKKRAYELTHEHGTRYKALAEAHIDGGRFIGRLIEVMTQYAFNQYKGVQHDPLTDDHFDIDKRFSEQTNIIRFYESVEKARKALEVLRS